MVRQITWQDFVDQMTKSLLTGETLEQFRKLSCNKERSNFCQTHPVISTLLLDWLKSNLKEKSFSKDLQKSMQLKTQGNDAFIVSKNDDKAIDLYNSALLFAPEDLSSVLYGNRSAVFFSKFMWQECINDIEAAITLNFPKARLWKLFCRRGEALIKLQRFQESNESFQKALSVMTGIPKVQEQIDRVTKYINENNKRMAQKVFTEEKPTTVEETNDIVPFKGWSSIMTCASSCISVNCDEKQGRYIMANQDIPSGSIIISETPYAAVLLSLWYKTHCSNCFTKVSVPFACRSCSQVVYCSTVCRDFSWTRNHYFECQKLNLLEQIGVARLALRVYLATPKDILHNYDYSSATSSSCSISSGFDSKGVYRGDFESMYNLLPHSEKMGVQDLFQYSVTGVLLLNLLLLSNKKDGKSYNMEGTRDIVGSLLIRHIQQLICNAHAITSLNDNASNRFDNIVEQDQVRIATAIYPTTSLFNHSCEPTIINCFQKDRLVVKTVRKVHAGEQIYNCYGPHFRRMDFAERQSALQQQYFFTCQCLHCIQGHSNDLLLNTFRCDKCNSGLSDHANLNVKCDADVETRRDFCQSKFDIYNEKFQNNLDFFNNNNIQYGRADLVDDALQVFLKCAKNYEDILYKHHKQLALSYDIIAKCYVTLLNYEASIPYIMKSIATTEVHYGSSSVELTNEMLKLSDVYMAMMQSFIDTQNVDGKIKRHLSSAIDVIEKTIALLHKNREASCHDLEVMKERHESLLKLSYLSR